jgi:hypothetical protein
LLTGLLEGISSSSTTCNDIILVLSVLKGEIKVEIAPSKSNQFSLQRLNLTFQCCIFGILVLGEFLEFGNPGLETLDMGFLSFPEGSLSSSILRLSFLNIQSESYYATGDKGTLAGSVIIIFRPGFFLGF